MCFARSLLSRFHPSIALTYLKTHYYYKGYLRMLCVRKYGKEPNKRFDS